MSTNGDSNDVTMTGFSPGNSPILRVEDVDINGLADAFDDEDRVDNSSRAAADGGTADGPTAEEELLMFPDEESDGTTSNQYVNLGAPPRLAEVNSIRVEESSPMLPVPNHQNDSPAAELDFDIIKPEDTEETGPLDFTSSSSADSIVEKAESDSHPDSFSYERIKMEDGNVKPIVEVKIVAPPDPALPYSSRRTGLVYDPRMRYHTELVSLEHDLHPEDPRRTYEIYRSLDKANLVSVSESDDEKHYFQRLQRIQARLAEKEEITLVHSLSHWDWVQSLQQRPERELRHLGKQMDSIYLHPMTEYCARLSAGGAIEAARAVVTGQVKNAIAVIRPPGHHAEHGEPGGFCFFNNVCVAARLMQTQYPDTIRKVLIVDWDVHHGNGIQNIFYEDPNVLYISIHVHANGTFYPQGDDGDHLHMGRGQGEGYNINIPWPQHGMRDGDYMHAFQKIVLPCAQEFDPDLVIIAAGFDAADGDQLGKCHVSPTGFAHMTQMLMSLAQGKILACLEGGYNLESIAKSAVAVTKTLMGEPPARLTDWQVSQSGVSTIQMVISAQARYWNNLYPKESMATRTERLEDDLLQTRYRDGQAASLALSHGMIKLYAKTRDKKISTDTMVLASPDWRSSGKPIVFIVRDDAEIKSLDDSIGGSLSMRSAVVLDRGEKYMVDAIGIGMAVIDMFVPSEFRDVPREKTSSAVNDLLAFVWLHYLSRDTNRPIFLLGMGSGLKHVVHLLDTNDRVKDAVTWVYGFLENEQVPMVKSRMDESIQEWYSGHSTVFVSSIHEVHNRKIRRRAGGVKKCDSSRLPDMLLEQKHVVLNDMAEKAGLSASIEQVHLEPTDQQEGNEEPSGSNDEPPAKRQKTEPLGSPDLGGVGVAQPESPSAAKKGAEDVGDEAPEAEVEAEAEVGPAELETEEVEMTED